MMQTIMHRQNLRFTPGLRSFGRVLATALMLALAMGMAMPARAAFHLWQIREIYTDGTGTKQYIEMFCPSSSQTFVSGQSIKVSSGGTTNTFTLNHGLSGDSLNHPLLFGTPLTTNSGGPPVDYILPTNFLFASGGSISFFGANSGTYTALPTNGSSSYVYPAGTTSANNPQNYAGTTGLITNIFPIAILLNPLAGQIFGAPGVVPVNVSASDPDGTIAYVRFITNGVLAGSNAAPPYSITLSNVAAGNLAVRGIATDNSGQIVNTTQVTIRVVAPPTISVQRGTNGPIQFSYPTISGVNYIVDRGLPLTNFSPVVTNAGSGGVLQFSETNGLPAQQTYRVRLQ